MQDLSRHKLMQRYQPVVSASPGAVGDCVINTDSLAARECVQRC